MKIRITKEDGYHVIKIYTKNATIQEQESLIKKIPDLFNEIKEIKTYEKLVKKFLKKNNIDLRDKVKP